MSLELFRAIRRAVSSSDCPIMTVHLGESPEEVELLEGNGPWRRMLGPFGRGATTGGAGHRPGALLDGTAPSIPGRSSCTCAARRTPPARLAALGATLVTCPRSNHWVGVGYPPIGVLRGRRRGGGGDRQPRERRGPQPVTELKAMRSSPPRAGAVSCSRAPRSVGARALGLAGSSGTFAGGKHPAILAIQVARSCADVEEYLVGGITPAQVAWV